MEKDNIYLARNNYEKMKKDKNNLKTLKNELQELESNELIIKYLDLKKRIMLATKSDLEIMYSSFKGIENVNEPIYVYMGQINSLGSRSNESFNARALYKCLEPGSTNILIDKTDMDDFESNNIVVKFKNDENLEYKFYLLQQFYLSTLLTNDFNNVYQIVNKLYKKIKEM